MRLCVNTIVSGAPHSVTLHQRCTLRRVLGLLWDLRGLERFSGQRCTSGAQIHHPQKTLQWSGWPERTWRSEWKGSGCFFPVSPHQCLKQVRTRPCPLWAGTRSRTSACTSWCTPWSCASRSRCTRGPRGSCKLSAPCSWLHEWAAAQSGDNENVSGHQTAASYTTKTYPSGWIVNLL